MPEMDLQTKFDMLLKVVEKQNDVIRQFSIHLEKNNEAVRRVCERMLEVSEETQALRTFLDNLLVEPITFVKREYVADSEEDQKEGQEEEGLQEIGEEGDFKEESLQKEEVQVEETTPEEESSGST